MPRSPFRPRNNNEDFVLSPESNCGSTCSPLRRASNSLRSPSLTPLSRALLRDKLLGSRVTQENFQQENEEGLDEVYENVETLLEVLRMERHQVGKGSLTLNLTQNLTLTLTRHAAAPIAIAGTLKDGWGAGSGELVGV